MMSITYAQINIKRPGRFDRVVRFRNPDANLRRQYYLRLNPADSG